VRLGRVLHIDSHELPSRGRNTVRGDVSPSTARPAGGGGRRGRRSAPAVRRPSKRSSMGRWYSAAQGRTNADTRLDSGECPEVARRGQSGCPHLATFSSRQAPFGPAVQILARTPEDGRAGPRRSAVSSWATCARHSFFDDRPSCPTASLDPPRHEFLPPPRSWKLPSSSWSFDTAIPPPATSGPRLEKELARGRPSSALGRLEDPPQRACRGVRLGVARRRSTMQCGPSWRPPATSREGGRPCVAIMIPLVARAGGSSELIGPIPKRDRRLSSRSASIDRTSHRTMIDLPRPPGRRRSAWPPEFLLLRQPRPSSDHYDSPGTTVEASSSRSTCELGLPQGHPSRPSPIRVAGIILSPSPRGGRRPGLMVGICGINGVSRLGGVPATQRLDYVSCSRFSSGPGARLAAAHSPSRNRDGGA